MLQNPPNITDISNLQKQIKKILNQAKQKNKPIFLTEKSNISAVILNIKAYKALLKNQKKKDNFWLLSQEKSLDFWNHSSNDAYEKLL